MRSRKRCSGQEAVNLFSFLNIMAATIGVQALLIVICALQIKPGVKAVQLLPAGGEGKGLQANYIICNGNSSLTIRGQGINGNYKLGDPRLNTFFEQLSLNRSSQYLVIAVKPSAFKDFEVIRSKAEYYKVKIGYEPIEDQLEVKLPQKLL